MNKESKFKMNMFLFLDLIKENKWFIGTITLVFAVNHIQKEFLLKYFVAFLCISALALVYYAIRIAFIKNKIIKLANEVIEDNKSKDNEIKKSKAQIQYLQGKPLTIIDEEGNIKIIQKGKDDETIFTQN